jgi:hypothetical protein
MVMTTKYQHCDDNVKVFLPFTSASLLKKTVLKMAYHQSVSLELITNVQSIQRQMLLEGKTLSQLQFFKGCDQLKHSTLVKLNVLRDH